MLGVPERAESVIASIRRASTESAARHADDIRDIVHGEREEMARQLQAEREEARAEREALEQRVLAERRLADDERDARMRELEEELARVRAELDHEKQQRDHDEDMRREADSQRVSERDEETRQQLSEITDLLLAHREEFAQKRETVEERWREKLEWREETNRQFQGLFGMVQGVMDSCAEAKAKCEEERLAAEQRPCKRESLVHAHVLTISQRLKMFWKGCKDYGNCLKR
jgi:acetoin utilization deacetylase AcuC-like enzyme